MKCKKCEEAGIITLRTSDYYCTKCFLYNINHKFRAAIGKNKLFKKHENVLLSVSDGRGSAVLLVMAKNAVSLETTKCLRITPIVFHIIDTKNANYLQQANSILSKCTLLNLKVYYVYLYEYLNNTSVLADCNILPFYDKSKDEDLFKIFNKMSPTVLADSVIKFKRSLMIRFANLLKCPYVFTAETTTTLASNFLTNIAIGRGSQIENDISFADNRNKDVKILRPLKDISEEELINYSNCQNLKFHNHVSDDQSSLQNLITSFVKDLQVNFQSTISTVCKTADKISFFDGNNTKQCIVCESNIFIGNEKLSAFDATTYSKLVSQSKLEKENLTVNDEISTHNLCYTCSRNYSDLPEYLYVKLK